MTTRDLLLAGLVLAGVSFPAGTYGQAPRSPEKIKQAAQEWLADFAKFQVLFNAEDVKKLQERVAAMSPEEAAAWFEKTAPQRQMLSSPEWVDTENWLRRFLNVQARYSDEQIRAFQTEAATKAKDSAVSLATVLNRVTEARRRLVTASQQSEATRQLALDANRAFQQNETRLREARRQNDSPPVATLPTPTVREHPAPNHAPLIDSLDVARWTVLNQLFPNW